MDSAPVVALPKLAFAPLFTASSALPLLFYIILGGYAIYTGILFFHWSSYASNGKVATATAVAYLAITIPLIIVMATTALVL